jgi:hypothetical protein
MDDLDTDRIALDDRDTVDLLVEAVSALISSLPKAVSMRPRCKESVTRRRRRGSRRSSHATAERELSRNSHPR